MEACNKLESGETKLLALATKAHAKSLKKKGASKAPDTDVESDPSSLGALVPRSERPTHKLGFLGLFGEKVDTIDWAREEIRTCTKVLDAARKVLETQSGEDEARAKKEGDNAEINLEDGDKQDELPHSDGKEKQPPKQSDGKEASEKEMDLNDFPALSSAFIMFNKQIAAHLAMQALLHHEPYRCVCLAGTLSRYQADSWFLG
jgi:calcium permeable stress-gated cation channel